MSQPDKPQNQNKPDLKPQDQAGEEHGNIKSPQRGPDDFQGRSDTPRGSGPETRGSSGPRG